MSNAEVRGRFVWHELLTTDTAAAAAFYPKVVPWRTQPSNMPGYTIFMASGLQVAGLMALPAERGRGALADVRGHAKRGCDGRRRRRGSVPGCARPRATSPTSGALPCSPTRRAQPSPCSPRAVGRRRRAHSRRAASPGTSWPRPTWRRRCVSTVGCSAGPRASVTTWARWASTSCSSTAARPSEGCATPRVPRRRPRG